VASLEQVDFGAAESAPEPVDAIELPDVSPEELELAPAAAFVPPASKVGLEAKRAARAPIEFEPLAVAPAVPSPAPAAPPVAGPADEALLREALARASRELIERIAWEVVPQLAETIIREQLDRLAKERQR
jgi:hypothetical protein